MGAGTGEVAAVHPRVGSRPRRRLRAAARVLVAAVCAFAAGCASAPPRQPLPATLAEQATVAGIADARYWADRPPGEFADWLRLPDAEIEARWSGIMDRPHAYLLISGGGGDGAFGAGLLVGWSEHGSRPEFQIVTGISTGALIAPFAFLGPGHDGLLKQLYTTLRTRDLVTQRSLYGALRHQSAFDTRPLRSLLERHLGDAEMAALAAEARRGRSLLIGTTNLDAARAMIWDITRIAASGAPGAKRLVHDVILASAAIPGAFPPVLIEAESDGRRYDELHVDGGVTAQLFLGPEGLDWSQVARRLRVQGQPQLYIVRNAQLMEPWKAVEPRLGPIVSRTIASLIHSQGVGDLARIYIAAQRTGLGFNLARVPPDFAREPVELFDPGYMGELFERGRTLAREGYPWIRGPAP